MAGKFPPQIKYIVGNEGCERYSYYGMRSILVIFMIQYLMMDKIEATSIYHIFAGSCYLIPLFGAYLSDRFVGKYRTIFWLSLVYVAGHGVLAFMDFGFDKEGQKTLLMTGLILIALGSGGIKPCVSAFVGDQFKSDQKEELRQVFNLFYFMINFGSFFATMITPWVLPTFGPGWAFGIPGVLMAIATFIFWLGRKQYVDVPPTGKNPHGTLAVLFSAFKNKTSGVSFWDGALKDHEPVHVEAVKAAFDVGKTFLTISIFWALFDQHGSTWIIQGREMIQEMTIFGTSFTILPSQVPALNPIMVMILIPVCAFGLYPFIDKYVYKLTPLRKMGVGMFVAAISFVMVAAIQYVLDGGGQVHIMWQVLPFFTITFAEVLISITGLEFAYTQAPMVMKSTIMSFWLLTVFFGNMFTAVFAKMNPFSTGDTINGNFFMFFAFLMALVGIIFVWQAVRYKMRDFMEG